MTLGEESCIECGGDPDLCGCWELDSPGPPHLTWTAIVIIYGAVLINSVLIAAIFGGSWIACAISSVLNVMFGLAMTNWLTRR